jgi:signal transduction histidine kinase
LLLAVAGHAGGGKLAEGVLLLGYALYRTVVPVRYAQGNLRNLLAILFEVGLCLGVVVSTGYWDSPYVFSLATAVVVGGLAQSFSLAIPMAVTVILAVSLPLFFLEGLTAALSDSAPWSGELLLIAMVAGYSRRLSREAEQRASHALTRVSHLSQANALLSELHRVAQVLPASLDLSETVTSTLGRLRELVEPDVVALLLRDEASDTWSVAAAEGVRLPTVIAGADLPAPLARVRTSPVSQLVPDLHAPGVGPGLSPRSGSGVYSPLRARARLVGLLAVERRMVGALDQQELTLMDGVAEQAALAVDNARWFGRLRRVGADEERNRIARDLHDRVGQSLAYLAFELDRISGKASEQAVTTIDVAPDLERLRDDMRQVVSEVRETLYDLRTGVSEDHHLVETLDGFLARVGQRTGIEVTFAHDVTEPLPLPLQREMWRIAQEAVTNAERHSGATRIDVRWTSDDAHALLEVADNGRGLAATSAGRPDSYGILGMRERADAIGASIEFESAPGAGTTVRCRLAREE